MSELHKEALMDVTVALELFEMIVVPKTGAPQVCNRIAKKAAERGKEALAILRDAVCREFAPNISLKSCPLCDNARVEIQIPYEHDDDWVVWCPLRPGASGCGLKLGRSSLFDVVEAWNKWNKYARR